MKRISFFILCAALLLVLTGCPYTGPDPEYKLNMYVSLGLATSYPAEHPVEDLTDLAGFGGKNIICSVTGIDADINETIIIQQTAEFGWTGGDISSSTQYAAAEIDLSENTMYLAGRYKFQMFIDWDGNGSLSSGDFVMGSYSILADKDGDEETPALEVSSSEYGTTIVYNAADYSITIDDPLSADAGVSWVITDIHEGILAIYP